MSSRMDKYLDNNGNEMSRTKKNEKSYSSVDIGDLSRIKTNNNVSVISSGKEIDMEKIKKYIYSMNEGPQEKNKRITIELPPEKEEIVTREEPKDYDVNSVLERAKGGREIDYNQERNRKVSSTQYDILKKIKVEPQRDPDEMESIDELNTEEKTIVDLINDISHTKSTKKEDLFADLMGEHDNTVVMAPITDEINNKKIKDELEHITRDIDEMRRPLDDATQDLLLEKEKLKNEVSLEELTEDLEDLEEEVNEKPRIEKIEPKEELTGRINKIDKSFFTNSLSFNKEDFDLEEEGEIDEEESKGNFFVTLAVALIIIILIATVIVVLNYVLELGWL